ncbi:MBL fold metallo-hydrolase [Sphingobacterium populi]|uniref:MBL fold metallo-hydrolase n=1 Tax=Sphingobacterium sp. CFCC 11742 TaxID=1775560 RepID=UPI000AC5695B|nr:MBL fold metallo-hydrolase [Sphingobacterium sp. CFCC 11742]
MKVTFLGTGTSQGVPMIGCHCHVCSSSDDKDKRLRSSILISYADRQFVVDTGPDFRAQMLREKVPRLDAVLITHSHKDHIAGLDDVRASIIYSKNLFLSMARRFRMKRFGGSFIMPLQIINIPAFRS